MHFLARQGHLSYKMSSCPRGKCVIINNEHFHNEAQNRDGAKHDEKRFEDLFQELGFHVDIRNNLTRNEMSKVVEDVAAEDHSNFDAFVLAIMTHGGDRDILCGVDDRTLTIEEVMMEFTAINCESLRNKPKLFIIQSCRGSSTEFISPANRHSDICVPTFHRDSTLARGAVPQGADFLLASSSTPGYLSYRYGESGSTFIQVSRKFLFCPVLIIIYFDLCSYFFIVHPLTKRCLVLAISVWKWVLSGGVVKKKGGI